MLIMQAHIDIEGLEEPFTQVHDVRIESGNDLLADVCTVRLPATHLGQVKQWEQQIRPGAKITVAIGYADDPERGVSYTPQTFYGYVTRTAPRQPFVIECEDATWLLRQVTINKSWGPADFPSLAGVISYVIGEVNAAFPDNGLGLQDDLPEVRFQQFRITNMNAAAVITKLQKEYGLTAYFIPGQAYHTLYIGLAYIRNSGTVVYDLYGNVVQSDLTYRRESDARLQVKVIGITRDNKRVESDPQGADGGDQRTLYRYDVTDKAALNQMAKEEAKKLVYDGFEGSLTGFLMPYVEHGMTAIVKDEDYPEREGRYHVDRVISTFGPQGGRNQVTLGVKLSA